MKRRPRADISQRRTRAKSPCPCCHRVLDAATHVGFDGCSAPLNLSGEATICAYCGALLVFADDAGRLRTLTEAERGSIRFAPVVRNLIDSWRAEVNARAERLTRTNPN